MALGEVGISNLNQYQGEVNEVERRFLFMGASPTGLVGKLTGVNATTDIESVFNGEVDGDLYKNLLAAQQNGGANWNAMVYGLQTDDIWTDLLPIAQKSMSFEAVVVTIPVAKESDITDAQTAMETAKASQARYMFAMLTTERLDNTADTGESWAEWIAKQTSLVTDVTADKVMVVPPTHGTNVGALAGRLARHDVTVADSPMRTATGAVLGLEAPLQDTDDGEMPETIYATLDAARLSVPQTYPDYPGMYWADGNVLDVPGGDYSVIEHLRVALKVMRRVRPLMIARIANRQLNSTANSTEVHKTYFMAPVRAMSKGAELMGIPFPGEVQPPKDGDINIVWESSIKATLYILVRPYNSAKSIQLGIALDLTKKD